MSDDFERRSRVFVCSLAVVGAMVLVTIASAQTPKPSKSLPPAWTRVPGVDVALPTEAELNAVEIGPELRRLVERVDAPSYDVREEAMGRLRRGACDKLHLYALLADPGLSAEQRHRLLSVLVEQILDAPRGAVGVSVNRARFVVQDLLPGLPAERVLLVGDRLMRLNGDLLETWDEFVIGVQLRPPGERVQLTIERSVRDAEGDLVLDDNGQPKRATEQIELVLGSADRLINPLTGQPQKGGVVMTARRDEVAQATKRFGPRAHRIQIRGAAPKLAPPGAVGGPVQ